MADQLDNRPVFTIVMGCNGAGKSAWKRANYDLLPTRYFDQDSIAGGIGDWNSEDARQRTRVYVDREIAVAIDARVDFGIESTYAGRPGPEMVQRMNEQGYRVEGVYIGTASPEINIERVHHRVAVHTGHYVEPQRIPERYRYSLSNLRRTAEKFDDLLIVDNSGHDDQRLPKPVEQCRFEEGELAWRRDEVTPWCTTWLERFAQSLAGRRVASRTDPGTPVSDPSSDSGGNPPQAAAQPADSDPPRGSAL